MAEMILAVAILCDFKDGDGTMKSACNLSMLTCLQKNSKGVLFSDLVFTCYQEFAGKTKK